jgi:hypothetical protein
LIAYAILKRTNGQAFTWSIIKARTMAAAKIPATIDGARAVINIPSSASVPMIRLGTLISGIDADRDRGAGDNDTDQRHDYDGQIFRRMARQVSNDSMGAGAIFAMFDVEVSTRSHIQCRMIEVFWTTAGAGLADGGDRRIC